MSDIIHLLPDSVANQIAAGEVVQRPASAVKELLENAVDAGASRIQLIIKDAGKTLIQVVDDGCGMSETDARMSFERHATSKIQQANDLFKIRTLGFRGEALASIAAIAQVELKTRRVEDEIGTVIQIEGSQVISQTHAQCPSGSSFSVKNLFYNVPARRNFLKADTVENRHIIEEFQRVALVYHDISFDLHMNGKVVFQLQASNLKQRIIQLFGSQLLSRIVPIEDKTDFVEIKGFVSKPEFAKRTKGEQYFFINGRYVKMPYFHHAVDAAFQELIPENAYPSYFIYFKVNPEQIDINIHPTKTEVKLIDERPIYAILKSVVKKSLGQFSLSPSLDFERETIFDGLDADPNRPIVQPTIKVNPDYNPFTNPRGIPKPLDQRNKENWEKLYSPGIQFHPLHPKTVEQAQDATELPERVPETITTKSVIQLQNRYLLSPVRSGLMLIDIQRAWERIYYERFVSNYEKGKISSQQELFPQLIHFTHTEASIVSEIKPELQKLGFVLEPAGINVFAIQGTPTGIEHIDSKELLSEIIEQYRVTQQEPLVQSFHAMALALARKLAPTLTVAMPVDTLIQLIDQLFACQLPTTSPDGKKIVRILETGMLAEFLR